MKDFFQEVPYAIRRLTQQPLPAIVSILILAAGIGTTIAVYTVVDRILLRPLPFDQPERLAVLWEKNPQQGKERDEVSPPDFLDWQRSSRTLKALAAFQYDAVTLTGQGEPAQLRAVRLTPEMFPLLAVRPLAGRPFLKLEGEQGHDRVVVLSHRFWQRIYGSDLGAVGRSLNLDGWPHEIVGVMPPEFRFPDDEAELWMPLALGSPDPKQRSRRSLNVVGRLQDGQTVEAVQAEMSAIARRLAETYPKSNQGWDVSVVPALEQVVEDIRPSLIAMLAAVLLVLLIACANLTSLLLVRSSGRAREFAIRLALGAGRRRIIRQMLVESLLLASVGGAIGVGVSELLVRLLVRTVGDYLPFSYRIHADLRAVVFGIGLSLFVGLLLGVAPAFRSTRVDVGELRTAAPTPGRGSTRFQTALVVGEIALALVLTVSASLLIQSFVRLHRVDPGFDPGGLLTARVSLPSARYQEESAKLAFFSELLDRLKARPGVGEAAGVSALPMSSVGIDFDLPVEIVERPVKRAGENPQADFRVATPSYFKTMRMRVLRGRSLEERDREESPRVMVINETFARQYWGKDDPIGQHVSIPMGGPHEVVGVVADVHHRGLDQQPRPEMYVPFAQVTFDSLMLVVRTAQNPNTFAGMLRREIQALDPSQPLSDVGTMESVIASSTSGARLSSTLATVLAVVALFLAAIGLYGVLAYWVTLRRREIGLRMALGATPNSIMGLVMRRGVGIAVAGLLAGFILAIWTTRAISGLLFGIGTFDMATFASVAGLLLVVAFAANFVPAYRAMRTEPTAALRED
jgi:putative ABC transport system permease protein